MADGLSRGDEPRRRRRGRQDEQQRLLRGLDAEQRVAVTTDAAPLAIVAAAGSGKTTVLTRRIAYRISDGSGRRRSTSWRSRSRATPPASCADACAGSDVREPIEAGTFHAVALRLLRDRALDDQHAPPGRRARSATG